MITKTPRMHNHKGTWNNDYTYKETGYPAHVKCLSWLLWELYVDMSLFTAHEYAIHNHVLPLEEADG